MRKGGRKVYNFCSSDNVKEFFELIETHGQRENPPSELYYNRLPSVMSNLPKVEFCQRKK